MLLSEFKQLIIIIAFNILHNFINPYYKIMNTCFILDFVWSWKSIYILWHMFFFFLKPCFYKKNNIKKFIAFHLKNWKSHLEISKKIQSKKVIRIITWIILFIKDDKTFFIQSKKMLDNNNNILYSVIFIATNLYNWFLQAYKL